MNPYSAAVSLEGVLGGQTAARFSPAASSDAAERVLGVLTSSAHRKGSLGRAQLDDQRAAMLASIRRHMARGAPIELTLMAFPFKVPNPAKVGARRLPDLAEVAALQRLQRMRQAAAAVYAPGLRLHLITDGRALAPIVGVQPDEVDAYEAYLRRMIRATDTTELIELHDYSALLGAVHHDVAAQHDRMRELARRWWALSRGGPVWIEAFRRTLGMLNVRHLPLDVIQRAIGEAQQGRLPAGLADLEARIHAAMVDYRAFDMLLHELDPRPERFPDAIHVTTQERPGRLAIWLVRRGRSHLPWHGVGSIDDRGTIRVGPVSELAGKPGVEPAFLPGEDTPFLYHQSVPSPAPRHSGAVLQEV